MKGVVRTISTVLVGVGSRPLVHAVYKYSVENPMDALVVTSIELTGSKYTYCPVAVTVGIKLALPAPYPPK